MEFVSPEGLRLDGRRPKELRRLACELGCLPHADGSAQLQMGNTKVGTPSPGRQDTLTTPGSGSAKGVLAVGDQPESSPAL